MLNFLIKIDDLTSLGALPEEVRLRLKKRVILEKDKDLVKPGMHTIPNDLVEKINFRLKRSLFSERESYFNFVPSVALESMTVFSRSASLYSAGVVYISCSKGLNLVLIVSEDSGLCSVVKKALPGYEYFLELKNFKSGMFIKSKHDLSLDDEDSDFSGAVSIKLPPGLDEYGEVVHYYAIHRDYSIPGNGGIDKDSELHPISPVFKCFGDKDSDNVDGIIGIYVDKYDAGGRRVHDKKRECTKRKYHIILEDGNLCVHCKREFNPGEEVSYVLPGSEELLSKTIEEHQSSIESFEEDTSGSNR